MYFDHHIKQLSRSCFSHLHIIAKLRSVVSQPGLEMMVHVFVSSQLNCNSLLTCLSKSTLHCLQIVQKAAARLLTRSSRTTRIIHILSSLHWFPVKFGVNFKVLVLYIQAVPCLSPNDSWDRLHPHDPAKDKRFG